MSKHAGLRHIYTQDEELGFRTVAFAAQLGRELVSEIEHFVKGLSAPPETSRHVARC